MRQRQPRHGDDTTALPSTGSKGGLLLVDSHFDPFRRQGVAADKDPSTLNNLPSRPQSSNIAFGLRPTYPFRECFELLPAEPFSEYCTDFGAQAPVNKFTDTKGWYPGIEIRGAAACSSATSTPRRSCRRWATPRTRPASSTRTGTRCRHFYGLDLGSNIVLGTGNPADDGVAIGVSIEVMKRRQGQQLRDRARRAGALASTNTQPGPDGPESETPRPPAPPGASARPGPMTSAKAGFSSLRHTVPG